MIEVCEAPSCLKKVEYFSPQRWCATHWDEWWDCPCGETVEGESGCDVHLYMRAE
jgi:hypothetical protein